MSNDENEVRMFPKYPILLVDDEELFLNGISMTLGSEGITNVIECFDSRKVIPLMKENRFSIILLDILMPKAINGDEILPQILEEQPDAKVIMLTAVSTVEMAVECLHLGAIDYLLKPVESAELIKKIRNVLMEE